MFGMKYAISGRQEASDSQGILQIVKKDRNNQIPNYWNEKKLKFISDDYNLEMNHHEISQKAKEMKKCKHDGEVYSFKINYLFEKHTEFKVCDKCKKVLKENHIESKNTQDLIDLKLAEFRLSEVEIELQEIEDNYLFRKEKERMKLEQVKKTIEDLKLKIK